MSNILINTAYFPPVQYFTKINNCTEIWIEQYESYGKQSYRNRCDIMTANGVMTLSVPVVKGSSIKILTKDVLVDYSTNWQKLHFKGIESAYKNSPYYDYYIDNFIHFFERKEKNSWITCNSNGQLNSQKTIIRHTIPSQTCGMLFTPNLPAAV